MLVLCSHADTPSPWYTDTLVTHSLLHRLPAFEHVILFPRAFTAPYADLSKLDDVSEAFAYGFKSLTDGVCCSSLWATDQWPAY